MKSGSIKYPIGEQSFSQLRNGNFLYVDKTKFIDLLLNDSKYYFLGRPRRFGKSLFLSTLKSFFEGDRMLFKDLYIDTTDWKWEPYPVFYLDLNNQKFQSADDLDILLESFLSDLESRYDVVPLQQNHSERFARIIRTAALKTGKSVVILVDEYDKPLVNNIHEKKLFSFYQASLGAFYSNLKSSADYIRLVFLTGVSRFGKLSVFSGLNNIRDISFNDEFASICGITDTELIDNFQCGIRNLAAFYSHTPEEEICRLKEWYDGYHFSEHSPDIYNPFSLLNVFANRAYRNYWISSGTPSLLAEQLKKYNTDLSRLISARCALTDLEGLDMDTICPTALFYQTGYLTIKKYDPEGDIFHLGIPNAEVKQGFFEFVLPYYASLGENSARIFALDFLHELDNGEIDRFMKRLQSMFAGISYEMRMDEERNVQNALFVLFHLLGFKADVEYHTSDGRIDILLRTSAYVYIMELKFDGSAREALQQIIEKDYGLPWAIDSRKVVGIGINYSSPKRRIDAWEVMQL